MNQDTGVTEFKSQKEIYFGAKKIIKSNLLPIEVSYKACDTDTKQEVNILSGEKIEAFEMNGNIYMSDSTYEKIKTAFNK